MNDTCHVQSLEKNLYLDAIGSFDCDFTLLSNYTSSCKLTCTWIKFDHKSSLYGYN
jgi:hypothetical protein